LSTGKGSVKIGGLRNLGIRGFRDSGFYLKSLNSSIPQFAIPIITILEFDTWISGWIDTFFGCPAS
jgi:hypothetical protein